MAARRRGDAIASRGRTPHAGATTTTQRVRTGRAVSRGRAVVQRPSGYVGGDSVATPAPPGPT